MSEWMDSMPGWMGKRMNESINQWTQCLAESVGKRKKERKKE
jgi:hypothetical protein